MDYYIWKSDLLKSIEYACVEEKNDLWFISSTVLIASNEKMAYKIDYTLEITKKWRIINSIINIDNLGKKKLIKIELNKKNNWVINGEKKINFNLCTDLDLGFSPLTNAIPIKRLNLRESESNNITALWVQYPSFEIKTLDQNYTNLGNNFYLYESDTSFKSKLRVTPHNFVMDYPTYWELVSYIE